MSIFDRPASDTTRLLNRPKSVKVKRAGKISQPLLRTVKCPICHKFYYDNELEYFYVKKNRGKNNV